MATYDYTARNDVGEEFRGVYTDVESLATLRSELTKLGCVLVRARRTRRPNSPTGRIRQRDVASFAYKFAGMCSAGLPIRVCLETLEKQTDSAAFRAVIAEAGRRVQAGAGLRAAFAAHRGVFPTFFLGMLEAGESSGRLAEALEASAVYLEKQLELREKTCAAFVYPLVVGVVCALVVTGLLVFVVPVFSNMYRKLQVEIPGPTKLLLTVSLVLRQWWWLLLPFLGGLVVVAGRLLRTPRARSLWDRLRIRLPLIGALSRMILVSRFVRTLGMLMSVGVPIVEALDAARRVADHEEVRRITAELQQAIRSGQSVATSLAKHDLFAPMIVQFVGSGEEAGMLPEMLCKAADLLDKDADKLAASLLVKLEPALTVLMGAVIGLILTGVYLPMFDYIACLK
jgi:type IV pilus assembly protein PilC